MDDREDERLMHAAKIFLIIYEKSKQGGGIEYMDIEKAIQEEPNQSVLDNLEYQNAISKIGGYYLVYPQLMQDLTKFLRNTENK